MPKIKPAERVKKSQAKLFAEIAKERVSILHFPVGGDTECWYCVDCGNPLWELKAHNFSHEEGKGRCPAKKYDKDNIKIRCFGCHYKHDNGVYPKNSDWLDD